MSKEITIVEADGTVTHPTMEELAKEHQHKWFSWVKDVCIALDKPIEFGAQVINDPSFFACFDDGLTPQQAAKEYQAYLESSNE